ncbi:MULTISPECIES: polyprenol phosphomannose-dependent alpha 1,6 mannosyltransferase MptB [Arthrobacter]|uniref:Polyprenol phosphomannose-dependent alpha 1,6 mannosyltransferase MptB n=2 Tax=Arthrobacter TaxID=1663 RepID=A0ABU9KHL0_9MICC|nr:polyprenol phosphomannose-dependent alpha 1,6 mannosyltransferase MptB [Arthrobacter sp. YJM1]MDP5225630.1 polyprenol phosphomannose-dependent alpha 1,6 mannosyltransferase MptB [Arthrobacter sp. YJM1]
MTDGPDTRDGTATVASPLERLRWLREPWSGRAWPAIVEGAIGSLLVFAGSIGMGWIAPASPMLRHPLVIFLRTEGQGLTASTLALSVGAMILIRSWIRLGQRLGGWQEGSLRTVVWAIGLWALPLFFAVPIFSRDVYAYTGQGRLVAEGLDPYSQGISSLSNWFSLGADQAWAENRTPYGPYFLWLARAVVGITGAQPDYSVLLFRVVALIGVGLCVVYVPKLPARHGINPGRALWLSVANPLFLISFVASAHNDVLMIGLAVAAFYFASVGRHKTALLLITASIGVKIITVVFLPFLGLMWAGKGASWPRRIVFWALAGAGSFAILAVSGIPYGLGFGWLFALTDPTPGYTGYAPSGFLGQQLEMFCNAFGLPGGDIATGFRSVLKLGSMALAALLILRGRHEYLVRRAGLAMAAIVLLSPIIQPWYIFWFVPLLAATGIRNDWQVKSFYVVVTFFVVFGAQDQLSVYSFVQLGVPVSTIAFAVALAMTAYLAFLDVHTRKALFGSRRSVEHWGVI